jgi:hypothetical protein
MEMARGSSFDMGLAGLGVRSSKSGATRGRRFASVFTPFRRGELARQVVDSVGIYDNLDIYNHYNYHGYRGYFSNLDKN